MTVPTIRWLVHHPQDQLGTGGWTDYPDRPTADEHAGTTAKVWALVSPEVLDDIERLTAQAARWMTEAQNQAVARDANFAEAERVAGELDGVREELARMAGDLDDARAERDRLRSDKAKLAATIAAYLETDGRGIHHAANTAHARAQRDEALAAVERLTAANTALDAKVTSLAGQVADLMAPRGAGGEFRYLEEALRNVRFDFWTCPVEGHSDRRGPNGELVETVHWEGDVAHCTMPGCGRTSIDERGGTDG